MGVGFEDEMTEGPSDDDDDDDDSIVVVVDVVVNVEVVVVIEIGEGTTAVVDDGGVGFSW